MADPRRNCPTTTEKANRLQNKKRGFFDAVRNIGKLEGLNEVGAGPVREGLEVLARVSDSIRAGQSVVPGREGDDLYNSTLAGIVGTGLDAVENGANVVLDASGIGRGALDAVNNIDAGTANRALGQAKSIFDRVKQGNFDLDDIPGAFQDLQNLEILVRRVFTPTQLEDSQINELNRSLCQPSPWAIDLVQRAPRFKFMYVVDIKFSPAYENWNKEMGPDLAFITKRSTRPNVDFEYDEVNMYNFWTKIIKRTVFQPMNMTFIDDNRNSAMNFYAAYMRAISPITNKKFESGTSGVTGSYENDSMRFNEEQDDQQLFGYTLPAYSSSVGTLQDTPTGEPTKNLLASISLYHVGNYGDTVTGFHMFNPRITSLQPDELSMADNGDGSEFIFEFNYDSLFVDPGVPVTEFGESRLAALGGGNVNATYPLIVTPTPGSEAGGGGNQRTG